MSFLQPGLIGILKNNKTGSPLFKIMTVLLVSNLLLSACTKKSTLGQNDSQGTAEEAVVNLSIWGNYLSPEMKAKFEKDTGIKINISNYSSNEELLTKVQMGSSGIDVAVPSDYMVGIMKKMSLLESLNDKQIPNKNLISDQFLKKNFDPENQVSLPYTWSTMGIAVNKNLFKGQIRSWKDFFNNVQLEGKLALLDDVRETIAAALIANGADANSTAAEDLAKAKATLLNTKKHMKMFTSDTIDILKNKEVLAAQAYSSDALQASVQTSGEIEYIIPEEGSVMSIDNLVIIKGAKHSEAAHKLINFLISQEAEISKIEHLRSGPVLKNIQAKLSKELQNNKALFPEATMLKKMGSLQDLGEKSKLWEDVWTEVKTN